MPRISYKWNRFPPTVIEYAVWLHFRFTVSLRNVEELLARRSVDVSYETIRAWASKFGPLANARFARLRTTEIGRASA